jgi:hypothetical protein
MFAYGVLATFYEARQAYITHLVAPSLVFFLTVYSLGQLLLIQNELDSWAVRFLPAVAWASLLQALFDVALALLAWWEREEAMRLMMAASLAGLPFFLLFWR